MPSIVQAGANLPISIVDGADFTIGLTITENAVAYPWAGATVTALIYEKDGFTPAPVTSWTFTPGASGVATMSLTDTQTATLGTGFYRYAIVVTKAGISTPWMAGQLIVRGPSYGASSGNEAVLEVTTGVGVTLEIITSGAGSGSMTAAQILAALITVDGAGSGLDADTLDGISSAGFATSIQGTTADNAVPKSLYDANTILIATADNTPIALPVAASTFVGRKASGDIDDMTPTEAWALLNVGASTGWAVSNVSSDKVFDANATSIDEIADVVGTLITFLISRGILTA